MKKTTVHLPEPSEAEIQKKAYHLWIEGGCRAGVELENWLAAKELLRHQHARASGDRRGPNAFPAPSARSDQFATSLVSPVSA